MFGSPQVVLVIQHAEVCPPGQVGDWLVEAGYRLQVVAAYAGEPLPRSIRNYSGLVVLGGEMGAYDDVAAPWLPRTKALLAEAVNAGVPTLGICLGHQLLAVAGGGRVAPSPVGQQGGALVVGRLPAAEDDPLLSTLPKDASGVHWNNDLVVELPPGAVELARSSAGVQAFRLGSAAWGVQVHPEATLAVVRRWAENDVASGHLSAGVAQEWLVEVAAAEAEMATVWRRVIDRFAARVCRESVS